MRKGLRCLRLVELAVLSDILAGAWSTRSRAGAFGESLDGIDIVA